MIDSNATRRGRGRSLAIALAASFALALPLQVLAQDAKDEPAGITFPVMLGGELLTAENFSGSEWLEQYSGEDADTAFIDGTEELVASVGKTIDDLTVKTALYQAVPGVPAVIAALRIDGVDAREWIGAAVDLMVPEVIEPGLALRPLSTKWTLRVTDATMPGVYPRTAYLKDDVAWLIQGDNDYVWEALDQLPDADPVAASSADSLYTDVPITLGGERRAGLYESTEPLILPTIGERLGLGVEAWLLDLYLEAGMSPAQMLGVLTWWGFQAGQDGIQIEGYRLPEGGEELTQQLLEDVFLVRPPEVSADPEAPFDEPLDEATSLLAGVGFSEGEIAGQAVTTLDYGEAKQHIFSSADTIWVISDPLDQRELVEEAIAALP